MSENHKENDKKKDIDPVTGVELSEHEWDGIRELYNNPPRWWYIIAIISIVWAFGYWVIYPAWPTLTGSHTEGVIGWTSQRALTESRKEIIKMQAKYASKFPGKTVEEIQKDPELREFAIAGGEAAFKNNCAMCHGNAANGKLGFSPNLRDDDWIWGGKINEIYQTIKYGIRANHPDTRISQMPAFGRDGILTKEQINLVTEYVLAWSNKKYSQSPEGAKIFKENCAVCHGDMGKGNHDLGAPNISDAIWLYGGDYKTVYNTIYNSRAGIMPAFIERLDDDTIKQVAIYIYSLGGGEE